MALLESERAAGKTKEKTKKQSESDAQPGNKGRTCLVGRLNYAAYGGGGKVKNNTSVGGPATAPVNRIPLSMLIHLCFGGLQAFQGNLQHVGRCFSRMYSRDGGGEMYVC